MITNMRDKYFDIRLNIYCFIKDKAINCHKVRYSIDDMTNAFTKNMDSILITQIENIIYGK